jgi:hypothetical protein
MIHEEIEPMFTAHVVVVVIAAPDDNRRFHTAIGHVLNWWNWASAEQHQIVLMTSRAQCRPPAEDLDLADGPVESLDHCDVFIAVFDPMGPHAAKTIGDVVRAKRAGKLVLAWVIAESPPHGLSADDQAWLSDVTQRLMKEGVVPRYIGHGDLHFESRLQSAIGADLTYTSLSTLKAHFESAAAARQVTNYRTPVALLGPQIWAVTVMNHSLSLATDLTVRVDAVDREGNDLFDGARRSRQAISDVFAKLRTGPWPDEHRPLIDRSGVSLARGPSFLTNAMDVLAAHTALDFPRWLRPNQHASALYVLEPNASPRVRVKFKDEAGEVWSRTNDAEPERVSSPPASKSMERRTSCPQVPTDPTAFPPTR